ncbi:MAG: T9SS type A sorting domain-containing protein [Crocinitomicaceae bacterium]|nr:T9SS type A sorting domain-containing protein [Crocinitomicaceae bacterium]
MIEGELSSNLNEGRIVITDISGRIVKEIQISGNRFRDIITIDNAKGIYLYNIIVDNASVHRGKIVIQ